MKDKTVLYFFLYFNLFKRNTIECISKVKRRQYNINLLQKLKMSENVNYGIEKNDGYTNL